MKAPATQAGDRRLRSAPLAEVSTGRLRGRQCDGALAFLGIPFAKPPLGALRWQAPAPPAPWAGVRDATAFGPCAMQSKIPGTVGELIGIATHETSEDCLYLNVWTPALDAAKRPVLVWIHGGGNTVGTGSQPRVNGEHLARRGDVVVVTINYRLGAFGFLHAPALGATGNEALLDQAAALRWVRQEIGAFGGDAANVTVFGQSAGGFDIAQLMAMSRAAGCFDKAVPMSGSLTTPVTVDAAAHAASALASAFGGVEKLRAAPADAIHACQGKIPDARWGPTLDGTVIADDPAAVLRTGRFTRSMPLLIGHTRDESTLFTMFNPRLAALDRAGLLALAKGPFGEHAEAAVTCFEAERGAAGLPTAPLDIWAAVATDRMFRMPAIRTAECHLAHTSTVWMYRFDHPSPAHDGRLGACHSVDIPFVWGTHRLPALRRFCGEGADVARLSERVMAAWLTFARHGDPNTDDLPHWPAYDARARSTMLLRTDPHLAPAPFEETRRLWTAR